MTIRRWLARRLDPDVYVALTDWQQGAEEWRVEQGQLQAEQRRANEAIRVLVWWLVQAQTGFGERDARGIVDILDGKTQEDS